MTPADLVAAVRERLDETERLAQAAKRGDGAWEYRDMREVDDDVYPWQVYAPDARIHAGTGFAPQEARHIAFHDPAAVLRRVAAQRRVLERHQPHIGDDGQATCEHCPADYEDELTPWPCPEIADLADGLGIDLEEET